MTSLCLYWVKLANHCDTSMESTHHWSFMSIVQWKSSPCMTFNFNMSGFAKTATDFDLSLIILTIDGISYAINFTWYAVELRLCVTKFCILTGKRTLLIANFCRGVENLMKFPLLFKRIIAWNALIFPWNFHVVFRWKFVKTKNEIWAFYLHYFSTILYFWLMIFFQLCETNYSDFPVGTNFN